MLIVDFVIFPDTDAELDRLIRFGYRLQSKRQRGVIRVNSRCLIHGTTSCPLPSWYGYANVAVQFGAITNGSVCTIVLTWLPETTNAHISGQSSRIWTHQSSVGEFSRNKNAGLVRMFLLRRLARVRRSAALTSMCVCTRAVVRVSGC